MSAHNVYNESTHGFILELLQETHIVLPEVADVVDAVAQHECAPAPCRRQSR